MILPFTRVGQLLAGDEVQVISPATASTISRFAPTVEVAPTGTDLVVRVQSASGSVVSGYIEATIAAGAKVATPATGSVSIPAGATVYVRVQSGPTGGSAAGYLAGYFETVGADGGGAFCTVADLKAFAGITVVDDDALLASIIARVTGAMQRYMGRTLVETTYTGERHSMNRARTDLVLDHGPIISVSEVRVDGTAVSASDYVVLANTRTLYAEGGWVAGSYHIAVDYTAGYATIPAALVSACLLQSRYIWSQYNAGADRFGEAQRAEASGGSTAFIVEDWYPGVESVLKSYRRLA